jgi:hypothetical protein
MKAVDSVGQTVGNMLYGMQGLSSDARRCVYYFEGAGLASF